MRLGERFGLLLQANQKDPLNPDQRAHPQVQPEQLNSCLSCATRVARGGGGISMARRVGQIVRRGARTWLVRVNNGGDPETKKRITHRNGGAKRRLAARDWSTGKARSESWVHPASRQ